MRILTAIITALHIVTFNPIRVDAALRHTLPPGYELITAAGPPLVRHPTMGCVAPDGALYVGDAAGLNLNKAELEQQLPNRVLKLVDHDGDGVYDQSTVFAAGMTFPQGACWHRGSLYVASPPGIWKLTDADGDGVAEDRKMIVGGFDYTGNAADVHGPFVHPNGRLYWCHGRKGHRVVQLPEGKMVHEGLASGIWSCLPDGADIQWHSLGCADNPTEIDFTPGGEIIGTCNLYYSQPRGDTLMHWLVGGVYERPDMMKAIDGLPRTLERMPVMHNFGHVAVSGCAFYRTGVMFPAGPGLHLFVTHFNTQRLVRMELEPEGSTYKATEHEFLKLHDPDIHLTDVMEDRDGSLLVLDTGGWFRLGCPSSLMAKPEVPGAVYRVRKQAHPRSLTSVEWKGAGVSIPAPWKVKDLAEVKKQLASGDPHLQRRALEALAANPAPMAVADLEISLEGDGPLLHAAVRALTSLGRTDHLNLAVSQNGPVSATWLLAQSQLCVEGRVPAADLLLSLKKILLRPEAAPAPVLDAALFALDRQADALRLLEPDFASWLERESLDPSQRRVLHRVLRKRLDSPAGRTVLTTMLSHPSRPIRQFAWEIAVESSSLPAEPAWAAPLKADLAALVKGSNTSGEGGQAALLALAGRLKNPQFDPLLAGLAESGSASPTLRLKALSAQTSSGREVGEGVFALLMDTAQDPANMTARVEAVRMLSAATLNGAQLGAILADLPGWGPLELAELLKGLRKYTKADDGRSIAAALARSPVLGSFQESTFRTLCSVWPPEVYRLLEPALLKAAEEQEKKKQQLEALAATVRASGDAEAGKKHFLEGKGACIACHKAAGAGRAIGPDLSTIGGIRRERDLLESILFPSATLARDYETQTVETADGRSVTGLVRSHSAEGLVLVDLAGQETNLPHDRIVARTTLATSLMPPGLDLTMSPQELCDLVAWLAGLK
jgi:putative membrane-bound dehydrogenase-like protein